MQIIRLPVTNSIGAVVRIYSTNRTMYMPMFVGMQRLEYTQYRAFDENIVLHSIYSYIANLK